MPDLEYRFTVKEMPEDERPREKLIRHGPDALSTPELLAIIMRVGNAKENAIQLATRLLNDYNLEKLSKASVVELKNTLGIGDAKACQILACFELGRRLLTYESHPAIKTPRDVAGIMSPEMSHLKKEHFKGAYLDIKSRLIHEETIFVGSLGESTVHPREIFKIAIEKSAAGVILVHNHPSGDPTPSSADVAFTKRMVEAGNLIGIEVYDHVIIGSDGYASLKEEGMI
ncbi:MAG TPA: JAB domain-containing protein [Methanosarcinales archaeon]|nr:JAB domain-containing protein [Methanosarcinales archaeon]